MNHDKIIIILLIIIIGLLLVGLLALNPFERKTDSVISITSAGELNDGDDLSILLTDANSTPIPNQNVNFTITDSNGNSVQKTFATDAQGAVVIPLEGLPAGQYGINVTYGGNDNFNPSQAFQNLNVKQVVTQSVGSADYLPSDLSIHPGFIPSYRDGQLVYGYKGDRFGFVTPSGNFHEM